MPLEILKIDLINWITSLESEDMLSRLNDLKNADKDWWEELPEKIKERILASQAEHEAGQSIPHEEQVEKIKDLM